MNILKITISLSLLCSAVPVAADLSPSEYASQESPLLRTKQVTTPSIRLTQRYASMKGPRSIRSFQLETEPDNARVWIRRYKIEVLDTAAEEESTEFLCHAWLMADTGLRDPESGHWGARGGRDPSLLLTISQGFEDMKFPDGFAVKYDSLDIRRVGLLTMAVNNNDDDIDKEIQFRATIDYLDDQAAAQLGIRALTGFQLHAKPSLSEVKAVHQHHAGEQSAASKTRTVDHWLVPPGRQVLRTDVKPGAIESDGLIHFIKIHLHPYGESVALVDKTTGEEIWKGDASNHPDRAHILSIDSYSSGTGIPIYKDRDYELVTTYNNPTGHNVDAMAVMRVYVHPTTERPAS